MFRSATTRPVVTAAVALFAGAAGLGLTATPRPATAAPAAPVVEEAEAGFEVARTSRLAAGLKLPAGAQRNTSGGDAIDKLFEPLVGDARNFTDAEPADRELLGWDLEKPGMPSGTAIRGKFVAGLKAAGYGYHEVGPTQDNPTGPVQFFFARSAQTGDRLLGFWITGDKNLLLLWVRLEGAGGPGTGRGVPAALVGPTWRTTRISGTTFWSQSGAYSGSGSGGAMMVQFFADGTYKLHAYNQSRASDWAMQTYTWENGTVHAAGDLLVLVPTGGKYKSSDSKLAHHNFDRAMTAEELKKNARLFRYELSGGALKMGSGRANLMTFKPTSGE